MDTSDYTMEVANRFKGLALIRQSAWRTTDEVCNIVPEAVTKITPKKKKYNKARWLSKEALQIAEKTREAKGKRAYTYLNAEFRRIARRDKRALGNNAKK